MPIVFHSLNESIAFRVSVPLAIFSLDALCTVSAVTIGIMAYVRRQLKGPIDSQGDHGCDRAY